MERMEIMRQRHSVRQYTAQPIEPDKRSVLDSLVQEINQKTGLHIQMIYDDPKCFDSFMATTENSPVSATTSLWSAKSRQIWRKCWDITGKNWF